MLIIPKSILTKHGINSENISFDLILDKKRITLLGPLTREAPEVIQSMVEIDT